MWIISAVAATALGVVLGYFTGRSVVYSGLRSLLVASAAALATFLIGRAVGVSL